MDSNTHSISYSAGRPDRLMALTAAVDELAAQDLDGLVDAVRGASGSWSGSLPAPPEP